MTFAKCWSFCLNVLREKCLPEDNWVHVPLFTVNISFVETLILDTQPDITAGKVKPH